ncbi:Protein of unknown function [Aneurinibacillus thermoaerophilus]|uniref:DUF2797 domain-containing protein n=1 Tax=Aneurinibacillus thermoaerophilus TaxID=143495 RepID=A0A1G8CKT8_ANETH|nr:DUF2797 domain-containing protein [Aneurinibacillus thermoaerophilus]SDH45949.1 Protein of unknown function [Aneurinibacillus thermoaerophilus]
MNARVRFCAKSSIFPRRHINIEQTNIVKHTGFLQGFVHKYENPVQYILKLNEAKVLMNGWIGRSIRVEFLDNIKCVHCGRSIKKTYNNGYCYPCFVKLPENDLCIVKPHECHYHLGTCRDSEWGVAHCMVPHYVYLAVSSGVKVGLTRKNNEKKRWVDQGAVQAIAIAEVPTRKIAGELEAYLTQYLADKTDWRKMLKGEVEPVDLIGLREKIYEYFPEEYKQYMIEEDEWMNFIYPILEQVQKVKPYNLDKQPVIEDRLIGMKGQYLLFENGVLNIRKYYGYQVEISG